MDDGCTDGLTDGSMDQRTDRQCQGVNGQIGKGQIDVWMMDR